MLPFYGTLHVDMDLASFMEFYNIKFALQKVLNIHSRILNPYNLMVPNLARAHVSLVRFWVFDQKYRDCSTPTSQEMKSSLF